MVILLSLLWSLERCNIHCSIVHMFNEYVSIVQYYSASVQFYADERPAKKTKKKKNTTTELQGAPTAQ